METAMKTSKQKILEGESSKIKLRMIKEILRKGRRNGQHHPDILKSIELAMEDNIFFMDANDLLESRIILRKDKGDIPVSLVLRKAELLEAIEYDLPTE